MCCTEARRSWKSRSNAFGFDLLSVSSQFSNCVTRFHLGLWSCLPLRLLVLQIQIIHRSYRSIISFAKQFEERGLPLHVLVENAGVFLVPYDRTQEGFETTVGTNYFGKANTDTGTVIWQNCASYPSSQHSASYSSNPTAVAHSLLSDVWDGCRPLLAIASPVRQAEGDWSEGWRSQVRQPYTIDWSPSLKSIRTVSEQHLNRHISQAFEAGAWVAISLASNEQ